MKWDQRIVSFGTDIWDPSHRFETSWLLTPWTLFTIRASFSLYAFTTLFFNLAWDSTKAGYGGTAAAALSFSYFTVLTYWGLAFYFLVAAVQTFGYARTGTPLLNRFPRPLQALHALYYTFITTYPFLVTIVYWGVIYTNWYVDDFSKWSNISEHGLNSFFALFELILTRANPPIWMHLFFLIVILCLYLALAFITHARTGVWVYAFLSPENGKALVAGYVLGILVAIIILFSASKYAITLRKWGAERKMGMLGRFHGGRSMGSGDVELEAQRIWAK